MPIGLKGFQKGDTPWNKDMKGYLPNEKHGSWKGENVSYSGIHKWINRHLGRAEECRFCHKKWDKPKSICWSNIDHKYRRTLSDWIPLCRSCHEIYDYNVLKINTKLGKPKQIK